MYVSDFDKWMSNYLENESFYELCLHLRLTPALINVLKLILRGWTNKEIADELYVSEKTVKFHMTAIFKKFQKVMGIKRTLNRGTIIPYSLLFSYYKPFIPYGFLKYYDQGMVDKLMMQYNSKDKNKSIDDRPNIVKENKVMLPHNSHNTIES